MLAGNQALSDAPLGRGWVEIFHSAPSWPGAVITFRVGQTAEPTTRRLIDSVERPGFRVFRTQLAPASDALSCDASDNTFTGPTHGSPNPGVHGHATNQRFGDILRPASSDERDKALHSFRFRLQPGESRNSMPANMTGLDIVYEIPDAAPGRYVVTTGRGVERVGDADIPQAIRLYRQADRYIELVFNATAPGAHAWSRCFVAYSPHNADEMKPPASDSRLRKHAHQAAAPLAVSDGEWPKQPMHRKASGGTPDSPAGPPVWFCRLMFTGMDCVFTNGDGAWDNNNGDKYVVPLPGSYVIGNGSIQYQGPSLLDRHQIDA